MNVTQKQCLLKYLGYDPGVIDGVDGPNTKSAMAKFTSDYNLTGLNSSMQDASLVGAVAGTISKSVTDNPQGNQEEECVNSAEKYLQSDGHYHIPRGVNVQLSKNLWSSEVECQGKGCCTESVISKAMVGKFQDIRDEYGEPISIGTAGGSGFRCKKHNAEPSVGGATNSLHLNGDAFDLHAGNKTKLLSIVIKHITDGEIGVYSWGIHAGVWNRGYVNRFNG